ncbi:hypothetical protein Taro_021541, partial [Colocasia esculenta]|nr:hypothetical protein [Colocasia esculenta]
MIEQERVRSLKGILGVRVQPTHRPCGNPWTEETYGGLEQRLTSPAEGVSVGEFVQVKIEGYNRLIDHVGIHGQRKLTEAFNKDSLVRQKEYPSESSSKSRKR